MPELQTKKEELYALPTGTIILARISSLEDTDKEFTDLKLGQIRKCEIEGHTIEVFNAKPHKGTHFLCKHEVELIRVLAYPNNGGD